MSQFAYVTLTDRNYIVPTFTLMKSLLLTEPDFPIRVMCLGDVSIEQRTQLQAMDSRVEAYPIDPIVLPDNVEAKFAAWEKAFSALRLFAFTEFDKIVYLDADMVVLENIDDLFNRPSLSAGSHHYPLRKGAINLNSGTMVLSPSPELLTRILDELIYLPSPLPPHRWSIPDQEMMIALYSTEDVAVQWRNEHRIAMNESWHCLDYRYNAITGLRVQQSAGWSLSEAKVLHYTRGPKPWRTQERNEANQIWWKFHDLVTSDGVLAR